MSTMAWLLTTEGLLQQLDVSEGSPLRETIERVLGSDLIGAIPLAMGICVWTNLLASLEAGLNAAALGLADRLLDSTDTRLPRFHGNVVIASWDELGDPVCIAPAAVQRLFAAS